MIDLCFENNQGGHVSYNCLLDIGNTFGVLDFGEKIDIEELCSVLRDAVSAYKVNPLMEYKKICNNVYGIYNVCIKLKNNNKNTKYTFSSIANEIINNQLTLRGIEISPDVTSKEMEELQLRFGGNPLVGLNKKSFLDATGKLREKFLTNKLLNSFIDAGDWISKNRAEDEYKLWCNLYKAFEKSKHNKKQANKLYEYYDFLKLSDTEILAKYGSDYGKSIIEKYNEDLFNLMINS